MGPQRRGQVSRDLGDSSGAEEEANVARLEEAASRVFELGEVARVAGLGLGRALADRGRQLLARDARDVFLGVAAHVDIGQEDAVRAREGLDEVAEEVPGPVGLVRLEAHHQAALGVALAGRRDHGLERGRVVGVVVDDHDVAGGLDVVAATDAAKGAHGLSGARRGHAGPRRAGDRDQGVGGVVSSGDGQADLGRGSPVHDEGEAPEPAVRAEVTGGIVVVVSEAPQLLGRALVLERDRVQLEVGASGQGLGRDSPAGRPIGLEHDGAAHGHAREEHGEALLELLEAGVAVEVIGLEVEERGHARGVAVEGAVELAGLEDQLRVCAGPGAGREVLGVSAHDPARVAPAGPQEVGQERGRGRLAVGPGDGDPALGRHEGAQGVGILDAGHAALGGRDQLHVVLGQGGGAHEEVELGGERLGALATGDGDPLLAELSHGRGHTAVGSRDLVPEALQQASQAREAGPADPAQEHAQGFVPRRARHALQEGLFERGALALISTALHSALSFHTCRIG